MMRKERELRPDRIHRLAVRMFLGLKRSRCQRSRGGRRIGQVGPGWRRPVRRVTAPFHQEVRLREQE